MPPDYRKRHPERISYRSIEINRPCPPGVSPPPGLVEAHHQAELRRPELKRQWLLRKETREKQNATNRANSIDAKLELVH
jgi:hypothetical protein